MKRLLSLALAAALALSLTACGGGSGGDDTSVSGSSGGVSSSSSSSSQGDASEPPEDDTPKIVMSNDTVEIKGICVDDSYVDSDGAPLKMVYLFYTMTANDSNEKIDSKYTEMTINDTNTYQSDHFSYFAAATEYTPNFMYTSYIQDVYVGSSANVVATFKVPEGDLGPGRTVSLSDSQIPGVEELSFTTDEFQHFSSPDDIAIAMDPDGHAAEVAGREEADEETTKTVRKLINGRSWWCMTNNIKYNVEFRSKDNFKVSTSLGFGGSGTYTVRNKYIFCKYPDIDKPVEIPYEIVDGEIKLSLLAAFDVRD